MAFRNRKAAGADRPTASPSPVAQSPILVGILQIVTGPLAARPLAQNLAVRVALATPVDFGEILEEKPRAVKQRQQRSIMIGGHWVP